MLLDLNADWSVATPYLNGPGMDNHLRQTNSSAGISYLLTDHLGSTAGLTDAAGNLVEQLAYDSFGNSIGSARTRYGYTGRERDSDTGLTYYRARWLDPQVGRFTSEDPIQFDGGSNWYGYAENDPIQFSDPTGLSKGDRWYGYRNKDFHKWFHRCWKESGDPDADKEAIEEAYREWISRGSPKGGNCWGGKQLEPTQCREPARNPTRSPVRIPFGPSQGELDSFAEAARQRHEFWKKVTIGGYLVGSVLTAGALSGGSAVAAPWLVPLFTP